MCIWLRRASSRHETMQGMKAGKVNYFKLRVYKRSGSVGKSTPTLSCFTYTHTRTSNMRLLVSWNGISHEILERSLSLVIKSLHIYTWNISLYITTKHKMFYSKGNSKCCIFFDYIFSNRISISSVNMALLYLPFQKFNRQSCLISLTHWNSYLTNL
jgi:hypothetical protein